MILRVVLLLALLLLESDGARILAVLPLPVGSHLNVFKPILRELANRGHDVTHVTVLPEDGANYKQIVLENTLEKRTGGHVDFLQMRKQFWYQGFIFISNLMEIMGDDNLQSEQMQQIIHSDLKFDLILVEATFFQEAYVAFGHKFNAPVIELSSIPATFWLNHVIGNPYMFSYCLDYIRPVTDRMTFWERFDNTINGIPYLLLHRYLNLPKHQALVDKHMRYNGWENRPPLIDLMANISLVILNTHLGMHYPHPNNPNVIEVPGLHIKPPKPLPKDLQTYLDTAKEGVIYFSLGSNLKSVDLPEATRLTFISAFAKLPHKVLWKWEAETMPNIPNNVKISKWFPQTDVLAHKNVKGFISHGGTNSLTESVYHGVPLVVIPIFADQLKNSKHVEAAGYGVFLDYDNITEESIIWAVNEIAKSSYHNAAKRRSAILRDNPMPAMDTAIYWIEYVIRHKGAPHLRSASISLPWYQYFLLDVAAVFIVVLILVLLTLYLCAKFLFRFLCRKLFKSKIRTHNISKKSK